MEFKLELVLIPVSDMDRAKSFYLDSVGFDLQVDVNVSDTFRVIQLNPPGSSCSVGFVSNMSTDEACPVKGLHLVVSDIVAARDALTERGVGVGEVRHMEEGKWVWGPHPERNSYESFAEFSDPDGNTWILQEVKPA